uniref:Gata transcription factor n=1 Tax=Panagrellus redivivus TaxID=6233 RepID=A0A7E5A0L0_PANRE
MTAIGNALDAVWSNVSLPPVHANLEDIGIDNGVTTTTTTMQEEHLHSTSGAGHEVSKVVSESHFSSEKVVTVSQHSEQVVQESVNTSSSYHIVSGSAESATLENGNVSHVALNGFSTLGNSNAFQVENGITDSEAEIKEVVLGAGSRHLSNASHVIEHIPGKNQQQDSIIAELKKVQHHDHVEYLSDDDTLKGSDDEDGHDGQHHRHVYEQVTETVTYDVPPPEPPRDYESDAISITTGDEPQDNITGLAASHINGVTETNHVLSHHSSHASVHHDAPSHHSSHHSLHEHIPSHHTSHSSLHSHHAHDLHELQRAKDLSLSSLTGSHHDLPQRPDSRTSTTSEARGVREVPIVVKDIKNGDADAFFTSKLSYNKQDVHTIREYGTTGDSRRSSTSTLRDFEDNEHETIPVAVRATAQYTNGASNNVNSSNATSNVVKTSTYTTYNYNKQPAYPQAPLPRETFAAAAAAAANAANAKNRTYTGHSEYEIHSHGYTNVPETKPRAYTGQSDIKARAYTGQSDVKTRAYTAQSEVKSRAHTGHSEVKSHGYNGRADVVRGGSSVASSRRESFSSCVNCPVCLGVAPNGQVVTKKNKADYAKADIAKTAVREAGKYDSLRVVKSVRSYKDFIDVFNQHELDLSREDDTIEHVVVPKPRYSISGRSSSLKASNPRTNKFLNHRPVLLPPHHIFQNDLAEKRGYASQQLYENHKHASNNGKLDRATSYHSLAEVEDAKRTGTILTIHEEEEYTPLDGRSRHTSHTETKRNTVYPEDFDDIDVSVDKLRQIFEDSRVNSRRTSVASIVPPSRHVQKAAAQQKQTQQIRCICRHSCR